MKIKLLFFLFGLFNVVTFFGMYLDETPDTSIFVGNPLPYEDLFSAVRSNDVKSVNELLTKKYEITGENINTIRNPVDLSGTLLSSAALFNANDVIELLFQRGADPNIDKPADFIPLYRSVFNNNFRGVELLLQNNAEITDGIMKLAIGGDPKILALLEEYKVKREKEKQKQLGQEEYKLEEYKLEEHC